MSEMVLRDRPMPADNRVKAGGCINCHGPAQFGANGFDEALVIGLDDFRALIPTAHGADECMARRRTLWESRRTPLYPENVAAANARCDVAETIHGMQHIVRSVAESNYRKTIVGYAPNVLRQLFIEILEHPRLVSGRASEHDGVRSPGIPPRAVYTPPRFRSLARLDFEPPYGNTTEGRSDKTVAKTVDQDTHPLSERPQSGTCGSRRGGSRTLLPTDAGGTLHPSQQAPILSFDRHETGECRAHAQSLGISRVYPSHKRISKHVSRFPSQVSPHKSRH
jgi:hypothetical protein